MKSWPVFLFMTCTIYVLRTIIWEEVTIFDFSPFTFIVLLLMRGGLSVGASFMSILCYDPVLTGTPLTV